MPAKLQKYRIRSDQDARAIHVHTLRNGPFYRFYRHRRDGTIREVRSLSENVSPLLMGAALLCDFTGQFHPGTRQDPNSWIAAGNEIAAIWETIGHDLTAATEDYGERQTQHSPSAA